MSLEIEDDLDLNQIAQKIEGAEFNSEKFPGLIMTSENSSLTIIIFSKGRKLITGLKRRDEAEQIVDKVINKIRKIGVNISNPRISIQSF